MRDPVGNFLENESENFQETLKEEDSKVSFEQELRDPLPTLKRSSNLQDSQLSTSIANSSRNRSVGTDRKRLRQTEEAADRRETRVLMKTLQMEAAL